MSSDPRALGPSPPPPVEVVPMASPAEDAEAAGGARDGAAGAPSQEPPPAGPVPEQPVKRKRGRPRKIKAEDGAPLPPQPPGPKIPPRTIVTRSATRGPPAPILDGSDPSDGEEDDLYGKKRRKSAGDSYGPDARRSRAAGAHPPCQQRRLSTTASLLAQSQAPQWTPLDLGTYRRASLIAQPPWCPPSAPDHAETAHLPLELNLAEAAHLPLELNRAEAAHLPLELTDVDPAPHPNLGAGDAVSVTSGSSGSPSLGGVPPPSAEMWSAMWSETFAQLSRGVMQDLSAAVCLAEGGGQGAGADDAPASLLPVAGFGPVVDKNLVNLFLKYFQTSIPLFHAPTFAASLHTKPLSFIHAVYAVAARHSSKPGSGNIYFEKAKEAVQAVCFDTRGSGPAACRPDLATVQTLVVLIFDVVTSGGAGEGLDDVWLAMAVSVARKLGLSRPTGAAEADAAGFRRAEERRRTFWALFFLDCYLGMIQRRAPYIRLAEIQIALPCDDAHWNKRSPEPLPARASQLPPFKAIKPIVSTSPFAAIAVFSYFMSRTLLCILENAEDGVALERELRLWYGLPSALSLQGPATLEPLQEVPDEPRAQSRWATLRHGMATLVSYHNLRAILFSKLAPERVLGEAKSILREMRFLIESPAFGTGAPVAEDSGVAGALPPFGRRRRSIDLAFPLWTPALAFAAEQICAHEGVAGAADDMQLVLEVSDQIAGNGWGITRQYCHALVGNVLDNGYLSTIRAALRARCPPSVGAV